MIKNKLILRLLTLLMILSTVLQTFSAYANSKGDEYKIQNISDYKIDKEVLEARLNEELSTDNQVLIDVSMNKDAKEVILVFQKTLLLDENSIVLNNMEIDKKYKDSGLYGAEYTSIRLKDSECNYKANSDTIKELSLKFDILNKFKKGDLFAVISDSYISILKFTNKNTDINADENADRYVNKTEDIVEDKDLDKNIVRIREDTIDNIVDKAVYKKEDNENIIKEGLRKGEETNNIDDNLINSLVPVFDLGTFRYPRAPIVNETYVKFSIIASTGDISGAVGWKLVKVNGQGGETIEKLGRITSSQKEIEFRNLKLNTKYRLYITEVNSVYERPIPAVSEFYFDTSGIHFNKGSGLIVINSRAGIKMGISVFVLDTSGNSIPNLGEIRFELKKETSDGETNINITTIIDGKVPNKINLDFDKHDVELNKKYKLYVTKVPTGFEKPGRSVSEFNFTVESGKLQINYIMGGSTIVLKKTGEQDKPLGENEYYGFVGVGDKIRVSKDYDNSTGEEAFCFRANDTFPAFGERVIYTRVEATPDELYSQAQKPRVEKKELYDTIRRIYYYAETHKEELLKNYGLDNRDFWETLAHKKDFGYYQAVQEAVWYYSNSYDDIKRYPKGSALHDTVKRAVDHIIEESVKVSDKDMNSIKIKIFKTYKNSTDGQPYQTLVSFELEKRTDIKLIKVTDDENELAGAVFKLEKLEDSSFQPLVKGDDKNISLFEFSDMTPGTYRITELKAPSGYEPLDKSIEFEIKEENGTFKVVLNSTDSNVKLDDSTLKFYIKNHKIKFILPETGGIGRSSMYFLGMTLLIISLIIINRRLRV